MSVKRESTVVASVVVVGADADIGDSTVDGTVELFKFPVFQPSVYSQDEKHVSAVFRLFN